MRRVDYRVKQYSRFFQLVRGNGGRTKLGCTPVIPTYQLREDVSVLFPVPGTLSQSGKTIGFVQPHAAISLVVYCI